MSTTISKRKLINGCDMFLTEIFEEDQGFEIVANKQTNKNSRILQPYWPTTIGSQSIK